MKNKIVLAFITLALVVLGSTEVMAQFPPALPDAPQQAPIDGGLGLLALGGGAYALKKLRGKK